MIGVSQKKVRDLVYSNQIGHFRVGDRILFTEPDIKEFLETSRVAPVSSG